MKKIDHIIYKTTNLINVKIYIGKDSNNNPRYIGSGERYFQNALKKYGRKNFKKEILEHCTSFKHTCDRERYWVLKLNPNLDKNIGYNQVIPNDDNCGYEWTDEMKKRQSEKIKEYYSNPENIKKMSKKLIKYWSKPENRKKHSKLMKKIMADPKIKQKISDSGKGRIPWNKGKTGIYSKETLQKLSDVHKGHTAWNKGVYKYHISRKDLYDLYIIQDKTRKEIANHFNCNQVTISRRLKKYNIKKIN